MHKLDKLDIYVGLSGPRLESEPIVFPRGIVLEATYAHLMGPMMMAFSPPASAGAHHPAPWRAVSGGLNQDILAQMFIPVSAASTFADRVEIANTIGFLLNLSFDPAITMPAMSTIPFSGYKTGDERAGFVMPFRNIARSFPLVVPEEAKSLDKLRWVVDNFETTLKLRKESTEFLLAGEALVDGQFVTNTALTLISLWGALEVLFSPSPSELRFRVSSLIAAYLFAPGTERLDNQKRIANLYDKRSAAAHGKPKHADDDLLSTFTLLRDCIMKSITEGAVPTKEQLEKRLFGV